MSASTSGSTITRVIASDCARGIRLRTRGAGWALGVDAIQALTEFFSLRWCQHDVARLQAIPQLADELEPFIGRERRDVEGGTSHERGLPRRGRKRQRMPRNVGEPVDDARTHAHVREKTSHLALCSCQPLEVPVGERRPFAFDVSRHQTAVACSVVEPHVSTLLDDKSSSPLACRSSGLMTGSGSAWSLEPRPGPPG